MAIAAVTASLQALQINDHPQAAGLLVTPLVAQLKEQSYTKKDLVQMALLAFKAAKEAIDALTTGDLQAFDALVSDCACQIRATQITVLAKTPARVGALAPRKAELASQIEQLKKQLAGMQQDVKNLTVLALHDMGMDRAVSRDVALLTRAYLLTKAKQLQNKATQCPDCPLVVKAVREITDEQQLNKLQKFTKAKILNSIVAVAKSQLADMGVQFLQAALPQLPLAAHTREVMLRREIPCILSIRAMLQLALMHDIPLFVRVRKAAHPFECATDPYDVEQLYRKGGVFHEALTPVQSVLDAFCGKLLPCSQPVAGLGPVIVIEGHRYGQDIINESTEAYRARLLQESIEDIIEMNAAAHKQYSNGGTVADLQLSDARAVQQAARASEVGASLQNQRLFSITHIFAESH